MPTDDGRDRGGGRRRRGGGSRISGTAMRRETEQKEESRQELASSDQARDCLRMDRMCGEQETGEE